MDCLGCSRSDHRILSDFSTYQAVAQRLSGVVAKVISVVNLRFFAETHNTSWSNSSWYLTFETIIAVILLLTTGKLRTATLNFYT